MRLGHSIFMGTPRGPPSSHPSCHTWEGKRKICRKTKIKRGQSILLAPILSEEKGKFVERQIVSPITSIRFRIQKWANVQSIFSVSVPKEKLCPSFSQVLQKWIFIGFPSTVPPNRLSSTHSFARQDVMGSDSDLVCVGPRLSWTKRERYVIRSLD